MRFKQNILAGLCFFLIATQGFAAATDSSSRAPDWAAPVNGTAINNFYKVTDEIYRSAQPSEEAAAALKAMGIKSIMNLRHYHKDSEVFTKNGIILYSYKMDAGSASVKDLIEVLKIIQAAPKPMLVHCHYGSDRTGFIIAGYRIVMMGWPVEKAIEEMRKGGFGYHELTFPDIMKTLRNMDIQAARNAINAKSPDKPLETAAGK